MYQNGSEGAFFHAFAMDLFFEAGHAATIDPIYINHSPEQFIYFDCEHGQALSSSQRGLFALFDNISHLFSFNECSFFSINLLTTKNDRSQTAHDIHTMIHPSLGVKGSICLFRFETEILFSFMGFGIRCMLSDWYPMVDDAGDLLAKLHVCNMSLDKPSDYFSDMVYMLARKYYFIPDDLPVCALLPINAFSGVYYEDIDRDEINQLIEDEINKPLREYGDDYVAYDDSSQVQHHEIREDIDLMLLEMDDADDEIGNPFGEDIEPEDEEFDDYEIPDDEITEEELASLDPELFRDPTLMVKWLQKRKDNSN